jgi:transposase
MVLSTDPGDGSPRQGVEDARWAQVVDRLPPAAAPSEPFEPFEPFDRRDRDELRELDEPQVPPRSSDRSEPFRLPESDGDETPGFDWDDMLAQLGSQPLDEGWVTLQEASSATGVARSTLRSWYRTSQIPSRMVAGVHGPQRFVPLDAVIGRALSSSRARRQLEHARSLESELDDLRRRVEALERHLGLA